MTKPKGAQLYGNDPVQKMLREAKLALDNDNKKHSVWCLLDAVWYLLADEPVAQEHIKAASDLLSPAEIDSNRGWQKGRKRDSG